MRGHGEGQLDEHAAGIALDGCVDEVAALGKFNDLRQLCVDLGAGLFQCVHLSTSFG
jgi:hypothetical protein